LQKVHVFEQANIESITALLQAWKPEKTILASVIHHDKEIETLLAQNSKFHLLGPKTHLSFTTPVGKPETIGADRIALITAAVDQFPNQHNLVIALGSCITYNFVNKQHEFLGGSISPGMQMRFKSMHDLTALLPMVEASSEFPLIGYDTKTNLLSGVILGIAAEIDGIIAAYEQKFANFNVLLTGGDICYFAPHLKKRIFADQNLIFKGLYAICEKNN
jgi:type III pantothenate kinase